MSNDIYTSSFHTQIMKAGRWKKQTWRCD